MMQRPTFFYATLLLVLLLIVGNGVVAAESDADAGVITPEEVDNNDENLAIDNVEECLDCTEKNCWFCESEHQFTATGQHFSMCECVVTGSSGENGGRPREGYCGAVYARFNRYANTQRMCIMGPNEVTTNDDNGDDDDNGTIKGERYVDESAAETIGILLGMLPLCCCLGMCCGCAMYYYIATLKREVDEERRQRECKAAMMKVVTARDLTRQHNISGHSTDFYVVDTSRNGGSTSDSSSAASDEEEVATPGGTAQHHMII
jgi:hypothetical protein